MRTNKIIVAIAALTSLVAIVLAAGIATAVAHGSAQASTPTAGQDSLQAARAATIRFQSLEIAQADGYTVLKDKDGIACIDNPGVGAMGIHYVNGRLVGSGRINSNTPQALVYEPGADGQLHLVAVEYVVFQQQWDAAHPGVLPELFGQTFMLTPDGNRFGLPAFYSLHAWIWKDNPTGTFSMWNPTVSCASANV